MPKTTRAARLNPRRYAGIVRLLQETITNKQAGIARRMRATELLLSLYERHDRAQERKQAQNATPAGPAETTATPDATTQTEGTDDDDAVTAARAFIAKLGNRAVHGEVTHE